MAMWWKFAIIPQPIIPNPVAMMFLESDVASGLSVEKNRKKACQLPAVLKPANILQTPAGIF
jgi:hypothetical protein